MTENNNLVTSTQGIIKKHYTNWALMMVCMTL